MSALEALQQFDAAPPPIGAAEPPNRPAPARKRFGVASAGVVVAAIAIVFVFRPMAMGRATPNNTVHICRSGMTERLAGDVVRAYASNRRLPASRFELSSRDTCDVRFGATADPSANVLGYDGIVVIVNPQNPLSHLSNTDARRIFRGEVTDWDELGGKPGPIVAYLTEEGTDEAQVLSQKFALGSSVGPGVRRFSTGAEIVKAVTSAGGRNAIGMVAFSDSVAAKVVKLDNAPAPSALSIGDQRYPLSVAITVQTDGTAHRSVADRLVRYAHSDAAQSIVSQDGFVTKKGSSMRRVQALLAACAFALAFAPVSAAAPKHTIVFGCTVALQRTAAQRKGSSPKRATTSGCATSTRTAG